MSDCSIRVFRSFPCIGKDNLMVGWKYSTDVITILAWCFRHLSFSKAKKMACMATSAYQQLRLIIKKK